MGEGVEEHGGAEEESGCVHGWVCMGCLRSVKG
jgi:hypothetical protein